MKTMFDYQQDIEEKEAVHTPYELPKKTGVRFAHMADCHLGAFREDILREMNIKFFEDAVDTCIQQNVDFILISGDLFDTNIPDMRIAERCAAKLRCAKDHEISVYVLYGSHDYSPTERSIIDVLKGAGLFKKVGGGVYENEKLTLQPLVDEKTGTKIYGLVARKRGLERTYFECLNVESLEKEQGFKVFMFHSTIIEYTPDFLKYAEGIPISLFPRDFQYYAGGHVHRHGIYQNTTHPLIVYPGHLFGADYSDIEENANTNPGFWLVDVDANSKITMNFIPTKIPPIVNINYSADGKTAREANDQLLILAENTDVRGKIVLVKISGELESGKISDVHTDTLRDRLSKRGALITLINRYGLKSKSTSNIKVDPSKPREQIEHEILFEAVCKSSIDIDTARALIEVFKSEQKDNETKEDYTRRIYENAKKCLEDHKCF